MNIYDKEQHLIGTVDATGRAQNIVYWTAFNPADGEPFAAGRSESITEAVDQMNMAHYRLESESVDAEETDER